MLASLTKWIGPLAPQKTNLSIGRGELHPNKTSSSYQTFKDWARWLLSVLCVSALISYDSLSKYFISKPPLVLEAPFPVEQQDPEPVKRSSCATGGVRGAAYDLPLHVAALFIILGTSTIACAFPILATRFPRLHIPASFLFFVSHFGTGVLIATAFVHLLPTAFGSLNDPCLSSFWTSDYPAMPGAIALAGVFFITVIEMVFSPAQSICRGGNHGSPQSSSSPCPDRDVPAKLDDPTSVEPRAQSSHSATLYFRPHVRDMGPLVGRSSSISRAINRMGDESGEIVRVSSAPEVQTHHEKENGAIQPDVERDEDHHVLTPEQKQKKETMQVYLLEMGILFHSVFIGMSLSVSIGNEFVILLIAIVFHRKLFIILLFVNELNNLQKLSKA
jgi:zinc transporter ZupT